MSAPGGVPDRSKGARTRSAIIATALVAFRRDGYDGATLAGIADELGITRSAVLHHFTSKASLLREVVEPFVAQLDELLDRIEALQPIPNRTRRQLLTEVVDLIADNRDVAAMLTGDRAVNAHLDADLQVADRASRFVAITVGTEGSSLAATRSLAALGSVVRPLAAADDLVDFDDPATRRLLVDSALAVLKVPLPVSPGSGPSRGRGGS